MTPFLLACRTLGNTAVAKTFESLTANFKDLFMTVDFYFRVWFFNFIKKKVPFCTSLIIFNAFSLLLSIALSIRFASGSKSSLSLLQSFPWRFDGGIPPLPPLSQTE